MSGLVAGVGEVLAMFSKGVCRYFSLIESVDNNFAHSEVVLPSVSMSNCGKVDFVVSNRGDNSSPFDFVRSVGDNLVQRICWMFPRVVGFTVFIANMKQLAFVCAHSVNPSGHRLGYG